LGFSTVTSRLLAVIAAATVCMAVSADGTANLPGADPYQGPGTLGSVEARFFDTDNQTWALEVLWPVGRDLDEEIDYGFSLFYMDTSGEDPIAGTIRDSEAWLLGARMRWLAHRGDGYTVAVIPGIEYPLNDMEGTNTAIPLTATSDDLILTLSIPVQVQVAPRTNVLVMPRYIGFDEAPKVGDGTIDGFGDVVAISAGVVHEIEGFVLHADAQVVVEGQNSINESTNALEDDLAWSAGATWVRDDGDLWIDLFATNVAGPTPATSIIATPDQSIGVGIRATGRF